MSKTKRQITPVKIREYGKPEEKLETW